MPTLPSRRVHEAVYGSLPLAHQPGERWLYNTRRRYARRAHRRASGKTPGDVPAGADLRAARHERHRLQRAGGQARPPARPATGPISRPARSASSTSVAGSLFARRRVFESGAGGLVSTVDDSAGLRRDDAEQRQVRGRAHPFPAVGRADDDRPDHARAEGSLLRRSSPASGTTGAGALAFPSSRSATIWRTPPAATAGTAATAPRGTSIPRRS